MKTYVHLELEVEVDFDFQPEEKMTRHYPGCPAAVEINSLFLNGKKLPTEMFNEIMEDFQEEIEEACWDEVKEEADCNALMKKAERMLK